MARAKRRATVLAEHGRRGARVAIQTSAPTAAWSSKVVVLTAAKPEPVTQDNGKHGPPATMRSAPTVRRRRFLAA